jgi:ABC-2 type transport system ATP-binding protein
VADEDTDGPGDVPAVEAEHLTHSYGELVAVNDLTLTISQGEIFGLLGPNGAGKTTAIRLFNTLVPVQKGRIRVLGLDVMRHPMDVRYNLGYVPQQLSVEGALTGRQNVTWFARLYGVPRRDRRARVDEALESMGLIDVADRVVSTYSGGMVRRLELAQALVNHPLLLILDEPTVGLDPVAREMVWERVVAMRAQIGMTVLLTTHYMEEADELCDRVGLMHQGRLQAVGTPGELKRQHGPDATLEDVFRAYAGAALSVNETEQEGLRNVRQARSRR